MLPAGSRGRAPGQGGEASLRLKHFYFSDVQWRPQIILPTFLKFENVKKSDICVIFCKKIMGGYETGGGGLESKGLPRRGPKTATGDFLKV